MKLGDVALTALLITISSAAPVMAQFRNPSQDFFERGWEQLEEEIQILQGEQPNPEENLEEVPSKPLLEVSPSASDSPNQLINKVESPSQQPDEVENSPQENQK
ncbi:MAG TPA: hypothetical protein V6C95_02435 [Coleofasciculaceae cyanobacterium]